MVKKKQPIIGVPPQELTLAQRLLESPSKMRSRKKTYSLRQVTLETKGRKKSSDQRKHNEVVGVLYLAFALMIFAGLLFEEHGQVKLVVEYMALLNGVGPVFIGLFAVYCGMKRLMGQRVFAKNSQILAFPLMYLSFIGFLGAVFPPLDEEFSTGGLLGNYLFWLLQSFLGDASAGILLGSLFLVSFMHVTDIYVTDLTQAVYLFLKEWFNRVFKVVKLVTVVCKEACAFTVSKIHSVLYVLIHDSIILVEKGFRPFGITIFEPATKVSIEHPSFQGSISGFEASPRLETAQNQGSEESLSLIQPSLKFSGPMDRPEILFGVESNPLPLQPEPQEEVKNVSWESREPTENPCDPQDLGLIVTHIVEEVILEPDPKTVSPEVISQALVEEVCQDEPLEPNQVETLEIPALDEHEDSSDLEPALPMQEPPASDPAPNKLEALPELKELMLSPPDAGFLQEPPRENLGDTQDNLWQKGSRLIQALDTYKVSADLVSFVQGPTITRFELSPAPGTKLSSIVKLTNEIAMSLASRTVRIEAPIPGTSKVGVEIPNDQPVPVYFKEVITSIQKDAALHPLTIALGKGIDAEPVIGNLAKMPHLLIAGSTGSGKSVCVNTLISSILFRATPEQVQFVMIDPKQVELAVYRGIRHLISDVVTQPEEAAAALRWAVDEMEQRYTLLSKFGVRHVDTFNEKLLAGELKSRTEGCLIPEKTLPYIVVIVDELADLMMAARKDVETSICRIAQKARAVGIHLVIATQRPSVDVITGVIKANLPSRIGFMVNSGIDSRTILDQIGAEALLGKGDMLYLPAGRRKPERVQGAFMTDDEVGRLVDQIRDNYGSAEYQDIVSGYLETEEAVVDDGDFYDEKMEVAVEVAFREQYVSTSMLQRHLGIGYNRAARIVDALFARGVCGSQESGKKRKILITPEDWQQMQGQKD
jgi:DNA segregation ATPase FtsK/SpoIIIE, S-DNA-T family